MNKVKRAILLVFFATAYISGLAQDRNSTFQFLNVAPDAYSMALGGINSSSSIMEPGAFINNPALSSDSLDNFVGFNYLAFSKAYHMLNSYYHYKFDDKRMISAGIRHFTSGNIDANDAAGNPTGEFSSSQTAITAGYSISQDNFRFGVNLNYITSGIASFRSNAVAFSFGGIFLHPNKDLTLGASIHNIGFLINDYSTTSDSKLPWDVQLGVTFKPEHMPFRFSLTGHHIFNDDLLNDEISDSKAKEVLSHMVIGTELIISRNISILAGYNHLVRQELKLQETAGGAGFSYGFSWNTKSLRISYGRGAYHVAGASHMLTLNLNLNRFFKII